MTLSGPFCFRFPTLAVEIRTVDDTLNTYTSRRLAFAGITPDSQDWLGLALVNCFTTTTTDAFEYIPVRTSCQAAALYYHELTPSFPLSL